MDRFDFLPSYHYEDVQGKSSVSLLESIGKPLRNFRIYGESVQQEGTPSPDNSIDIVSVGEKTKNLLYIPDVITTKTGLDIVADSKTQTIRVKGTATGGGRLNYITQITLVMIMYLQINMSL